MNTGDKLVLIDTGTAGQIADSAGFMNANLDAAGLTPGLIDTDPHFAFSSRPYRRHQDQGRRQGVRQCRDSGAGAGVEILDGRRQHEPGDWRGASLFPERAPHLQGHRQRGAAVPARRRDRPRHRFASGLRPHARPHGVRDLFGQSIDAGDERHGARAVAVRPPSRMAAESTTWMGRWRPKRAP